MGRQLDPREWFRVHAGFDEHPKISPLSDAAFRAVIEAFGLSKRSRNDGRIPIGTWERKWKPKVRRELVAAGLHEIDGDAVIVHDWLDWQYSVAELDAKRKVRAEVGRMGGKRSGESRRRANQTGTETEPNGEAIASPEGGHETVTSVEKSAEPAHRNGARRSHEKTSGSDSVETRSPAGTSETGEAIASGLVDQTAKQTTNLGEAELEKELDTTGHLRGERHLVDARASRDESPPKFHAEHPDQWADGCDECDAIAAAFIAWKERRAAEIRASAGGLGVRPADRCVAHLADPNPPNCGKCADARRHAEAWDIEHRKRLHSAAASKRAAIAECTLCDEAGWRIPPRELDDLDPRAVRCDHFPSTPAAWVPLLAALHTESEPAPEEIAHG